VPSPLSAVPERTRRHLAGVLGLFAVLFTAVGTVAATRAGTAVLQAVVVIALVIALLLALLAWGFAYSIKIDASETALDDAVAEALGGRPASLCSCGHEHDPTELHVTDASDEPGDVCGHDGAGTACGHDCASCILAANRPLPRRPSPTQT
jgi:hypothetical protein